VFGVVKGEDEEVGMRGTRKGKKEEKVERAMIQNAIVQGLQPFILVVGVRADLLCNYFIFLSLHNECTWQFTKLSVQQRFVFF